MNCSHCGETVEAHWLKCPSCGNPTGTARLVDSVTNHLQKVEDRVTHINGEVDSLRRDLASLVEKFESSPVIIEENPAEELPQAVERSGQPASASQPDPDPDPVPESDVVVPVRKSSAGSRFDPVDANDGEISFGLKSLLVMGVLTLLFGLGYFLKFSIERGYIGPLARIMMVAGLGLIGLIVSRHQRARGLGEFANKVAGASFVAFYFCGWAGFQLYELITRGTSFALMSVITGWAGWLAWRHSSLALALLGVLGGFATPLLTASGSLPYTLLMSWLVVLNLGVLFLARARHWPFLAPCASLFTWFYYASWMSQEWTVELLPLASGFAMAFMLMHVLVPVARHFDPGYRGRVGGAVTACLNCVVGYGFLHFQFTSAVSETAPAWICLVLAGLLALLSLRLREEGGWIPAGRFILTLSVIFFVLAPAILLSANAMTLAWLGQAVALALLARSTLDRPLLNMSILVLLTSMFRFILVDTPGIYGFDGMTGTYDAGYGSGLFARIFNFLAITGSLVWFGRLTARFGADGMGRFLLTMAGVFGFIWTNVETVAFTGDHLPHLRLAALSLLWALWAGCLVVGGFRTDSAAVRRTGLGLFAATFLKVFLLDIANAGPAGRIVSFTGLGLLMVAGSWFYHRFQRNRAVVNRE